MATYLPLPPNQVTATADTTGLNSGNWTNAFTASDLGINMPYFELSQASIENAPSGATVRVIIGGHWLYTATAPGFGGVTAYDPVNAPILLPGQDLYFLWDAAATGTPPTVTCFFRYDIDIPANAASRVA